MVVVNVAVIIPTINANPTMLHRCIELCADTAPDAQLIVADYGGTFAENCNEAASQTDADVLVFLNDDTEPQPGWLDRMVDCLDMAPIVGARLLYPDGRVQHSGVYFEQDDGGLVARNRTWDCPSGEVDAVTGAALMIRRDIWSLLDGFDTDYRNGYEDVDLCLRARLRGNPIWYCADATIIHHESQSGEARWTHVGHNIRLLQERWIISDSPDT